jgi:hypothetical protein
VNNELSVYFYIFNKLLHEADKPSLLFLKNKLEQKEKTFLVDSLLFYIDGLIEDLDKPIDL